MKYFLDTEFIENGRTIDLISIGIVSEDERTYYAINSECAFSKANDWVLENVLRSIGLDRRGFYLNPSDPSTSANYKNSVAIAKTKNQIAFEVMAFVKELKGEETSLNYEELHQLLIKPKPEFWGYYASYDWVVLCQLFGKMIDLPKSFPMYCRDIKQFCDDLGNPQLPKQTEGEHNALADAQWNKLAWEFLNKYSEDCVVERS